MNLLLAEDDEVSRVFLCEVLRAAGHSVSAAADGKAALTLTNVQPFDLLLLDLNLPGLRGDELLHRLRSAAASSPSLNGDTPAIALTADLDATQRARLLAAGFADAIGKPVSGEALVARVAGRGRGPHLASASTTGDVSVATMPLWDDSAALAVAGGNQTSVAALRSLFRQELPIQRQRMAAAIAVGDIATLAGELHRLRASCGFCGAARLGELARTLSAELTTAHGAQSPSLDAVITACDALLQSFE